MNVLKAVQVVTREDIARQFAEIGDRLERRYIRDEPPMCGALSVTLDPYGDKVAMIFVPDVVRNVA